MAALLSACAFWALVTAQASALLGKTLVHWVYLVLDAPVSALNLVLPVGARANMALQFTRDTGPQGTPLQGLLHYVVVGTVAWFIVLQLVAWLLGRLRRQGGTATAP